MRLSQVIPYATSFLVIVGAAFSARAVTIETVPIGNPGNPADVRYPDYMRRGNVGAVSYSFAMGKTEVTNSQYVEFLNAVAASDPYELYHPDMTANTIGGIVRNGSDGAYTYEVKSPSIGNGPGGTNYTYENKPVVFVSWFDAARFANWLHNGQGGGDTESGAYTLLGGTPVPLNAEYPSVVTRNPSAKWWLPNWDEWYKAAIYDGDAGVYYDYPMGNDIPNNNLPTDDTGNSANFWDGSYSEVWPPQSNTTTGNSQYPLTDAGAYQLSASPYGTFDQVGNVAEWHEEMEWQSTSTLFVGINGGSWAQQVYDEENGGIHWWLAPADDGPQYDLAHLGFRLAAAVPEPSTVGLIWVAIFSCCHFRRRRR